MSRRCNSERQMGAAGERGFALVSAIFLLVILVSLAAFLVNISTSQSITSAQDVQGSRAYHAARAGADWGLYQVLDPTTFVAPGNAAWPNMPPCPAASTSLSIEGFVVKVTCASTDYSEYGLNHRIRVYQLVSTATQGVSGTTGYVERQLAVTVSKCRTLDGAAPGYECQ